MNYSLELRNPYFHRKKFSVALLHFTAGFLLLDAWYESSIQASLPFLGALFLIIAGFEVVYTFFAFRMMHRRPLLNGIIRLAAAFTFLLYSFILFGSSQTLFGIFMLVLAVAFVMIFFIEKRWAKPLVIEVNDQGVLFPGTFKNPLIPWKNFNNVILKDNILTLDLTTNRIMQLEMRAIPDRKKIEDINDFCKKKIKVN